MGWDGTVLRWDGTVLRGQGKVKVRERRGCHVHSPDLRSFSLGCTSYNNNIIWNLYGRNTVAPKHSVIRRGKERKGKVTS
jgi:hypothetical protein